MKKAFTVWFTGLSGAGKSSLSKPFAEALKTRGVPVELLDGDEVRTNLSRGLGFTKEDRDINIKRIGYVCKLLTRNGVWAVTAAISPYEDTRQYNRAQIKNYVEVYVKCSLEELARRDVKGLYKKAMAGEIKNFTGVSDPYEPPLHPHITVDTEKESLEESLKKVLSYFEEKKLIQARD